MWAKSRVYINYQNQIIICRAWPGLLIVLSLSTSWYHQVLGSFPRTKKVHPTILSLRKKNRAIVPDAIIHSRITNDERALRRVVKKFSNYTAVAYPQPDSASTEQPSTAVEDARESFLIELSSFSLQLKKVVMVCEAETRQVEEYYREKHRIGE